MILLVDTHVVLWAAGEPHKLTRDARNLIDDPLVQLWFSAASIWEVAVKHGLGRGDFRVDPRRLRRGLIDNDWRELAVTSEHATATADLPPIYKDPFDRMLLAQAKVEGMTVLTSDAIVAQYPGPVLTV